MDSPVCLVAPETEMDIHMQRMLKKTQGYDGAAQHVLEINDHHPVIRQLKSLVANDSQEKSIRAPSPFSNS